MTQSIPRKPQPHSEHITPSVQMWAKKDSPRKRMKLAFCPFRVGRTSAWRRFPTCYRRIVVEQATSATSGIHSELLDFTFNNPRTGRWFTLLGAKWRNIYILLKTSSQTVGREPWSKRDTIGPCFRWTVARDLNHKKKKSDRRGEYKTKILVGDFELIASWTRWFRETPSL